MECFSSFRLGESEYQLLNVSHSFPFIVNDDSVSVVKVKTKPFAAVRHWMCSRVTVEKVLKSETNGGMILVLESTNTFGTETIMFPMIDLNKRDLTKLKGRVIFDDRLTDDIIRYLSCSATKALHLILYESVGWFKAEEEYFFRTDKVIADKELSEIGYQYNGSLNLEPNNGLGENYLYCLNSVLATEGAMFAVVAGLSSAIVGALRPMYDLDNLLIHLYGDSSSGKSTFLKLALSCWGKPNESPLFSEWNSTVNAIYALLSGNNGVAIGLDEASGIKCDFTSLIYNLAHGRDKAKCNKDSSLRELQQWSTTIISTAEESLIAKTSKNNGIRARCLEFFELKVTLNAEHAEQINDLILNNYGLLGNMFVQYVVNKRAEYLSRDYEWCLHYIRATAKNEHQLKDRVSKSYAVLLLTALYARRIGVAIIPKSILNVLKHRDDSLAEETRSAEDLYNAIGAYIFSHKDRFPYKESGTINIFGNMEGYIQRNEIVILAPVFEKIAKENRFSDITLACKWLHQAGYLMKKYDDRYKTSIVVQGIQTKAYFLWSKWSDISDLSLVRGRRVGKNKESVESDDGETTITVISGKE